MSPGDQDPFCGLLASLLNALKKKTWEEAQDGKIFGASSKGGDSSAFAAARRRRWIIEEENTVMKGKRTTWLLI